MRSIRCSKRHEELVRRLGNRPFQSMREFMCFAAKLGFERGDPIEMDSEITDIVDGRIFSNSAIAMDVLYSIGLASSPSISILDDDKEEDLISSFEGYAETGLSYIQEILLDNPSETDSINVLIKEITKQYLTDKHIQIEVDPHTVKF